VRFTPDDIPDLSDRTAVVTGANSGIGRFTARELAAHGARVVFACRNVDAARAAAESVPGDTRVEQLDLSSLRSVREFARRWRGPLDILVNNAGVMAPPRYRQTADGHELMFGTNHLGHFALTGLLLPALLEAAHPRVVTVGSIAHHGGTDRVLAANPPEGYQPGTYYAHSKLANVLFLRELHRRAVAVGSRLESVGAHPGVAATNLVASRDGRGANPVIRRTARYFMPVFFQSASRGADATLYAAALAKPGSYTGPQRWGETRGPIGPGKVSPYARNVDLARQLWELSEQKTGVRFHIP